MGLVDGGMNEQFLKWGTTQTGPETYDPTDYWELQLKQMKEAEAAGKYYLGITPSTATDRNAARYGFASMLLAGGGKLQFALHNDYTNERWFDEFDYAIGTPSAPRPRTPAASTSASSPTASSTSTRRRAPSASTSAAPTPAPACRTPPRPPCRHEAAWCWQRRVMARPFRPPRPGDGRNR